MKMIMAALAASALLMAAAAPASAQVDMEQIAEMLAKKAGDADIAKFVKEGRSLPRQIESDPDKPAVGSSAWWQQVDRDRPARRR
jgi:uncharacterized low-complexity protein